MQEKIKNLINEAFTKVFSERFNLLTEKKSTMTISDIIKRMEKDFRDTNRYIQYISIYNVRMFYQRNGGVLKFYANSQSPNRNEYKLLIQFTGIKEYQFASDKTFEYKDPKTGKVRYIEKADPQKHPVKVKSTSPDFIWRGQLACYHHGCLYGNVTKRFTSYKKKTNRPPIKSNAEKIPVLGKHLWGFIKTLMEEGYIIKKWRK